MEWFVFHGFGILLKQEGVANPIIQQITVNKPVG